MTRSSLIVQTEDLFSLSIEYMAIEAASASVVLLDAATRYAFTVPLVGKAYCSLVRQINVPSVSWTSLDNAIFPLKIAAI